MQVNVFTIQLELSNQCWENGPDIFTLAAWPGADRT